MKPGCFFAVITKQTNEFRNKAVRIGYHPSLYMSKKRLALFYIVELTSIEESCESMLCSKDYDSKAEQGVVIWFNLLHWLIEIKVL